MNKEEILVKDLAGCSVKTEEGDVIGELVDVYPTGANDVYVVRSPNREYLIPALKSVVLKIDVINKTIVVRLPDGLREIYET